MAAICGRGARRRSAEAEGGSRGGVAGSAEDADEYDVLDMDVFSVKAEVGEELGVCAFVRASWGGS